MYRLSCPDQTPPGEWRWELPENKLRFTAQTKTALLDKIRKHCDANGILVPRNLPELVEDFVCNENHGFNCESLDGRSGFWATFTSIINGLSVLTPWLADGRPTVSQAVADARGETCSNCAFNSSPEGCAPCQHQAVTNRVAAFIGSLRTPQHDKLQACKLCGCALRCKVWVPMSYLKRAKLFDPEVLPDWCWVKKGYSE